MISIIFISGFAASNEYSLPMCRELQYLTQTRVYNFNLTHGCTLEEECINIVKSIKGDRFILIGFSTGCLIAMELANKNYINVYHIILCNPAEVLTRLNYPLLDSMLDTRPTSKNILSFMPIWQPHKYSMFALLLYKLLWRGLDILWMLSRYFLGAKLLSIIYYHFVARHVNEPHATELEKLLFQKDLKELRTTITECLLKPSLIENIRIYDRQIHILQGIEDILYIPYVNALFYHNKNVILHRVQGGDHHMIYHYPKLIAVRIASITTHMKSNLI